MSEFERRMGDMIQHVQFRQRENNFQKQLNKKVRQIKNDNNILVKADKTSNFYKMSPNDYKTLLEKNIQSTYKKTSTKIENVLEKEQVQIATSLKIEDRVDKTARREAFVTLKDHKPNFENKPTCRLINPAKPELGKASKIVLQNITKNLLNAEKLNLWRNSAEVINWFKNIEKKQSTAFICFDIVDFYPSISYDLLMKAIKFASQKITITEQEIKLITHTKKSLLFTPNDTWVKTNNIDGKMGLTSQ